MKKTFLKSALIAMVALGLTAGAASAIPLLSELTPEFSGYPIADSGAGEVTLTDVDGTADTAVATLYFAYGDYYNNNYLSFGVYDYYDPSKKLELGAPGVDIGFANTLTFDVANGMAKVGDGVFEEFGTTFGFYLINTNTGNTFFTRNSYNSDGFFDHAAIYDTSIITNGPSALVNSDVIVAFEDLFGGGDGDYNDFIFGVSDVAPVTGSSPVPEPATMLLFGTGLAGLAGMARRKKR